MKTETRSFYEAAVERAVLRITKTLDEALDLGALARETALSPFHFHRIFLRHLGPYPRISEAFARLGTIAGPAGLYRCPDAMMLAINCDDPEATPASELRSDAGLTISEEARLPEGLSERRLSGGRYARYTHVGPYTELPDVWARLMGQWLPASGQRMDDRSSFEVYRNTPADAPPDELRTDLYLPIA